jgi:hypothetical protein
VPKSLRRIKTGDGAHAFRAAGDKRHVYLSNRVANTISKIDLQTLQVVATYPAPGGPDCMDVMAGGRYCCWSPRAGPASSRSSTPSRARWCGR